MEGEKMKKLLLIGTFLATAVLLISIVVVLAAPTEPPAYAEIRSPLLLSKIPVDKVTKDVNDNECWAAPYLTPNSPRPTFCTHWYGPGEIEARWTEEQIELGRGSSNGAALWATGGITITYADGTNLRCISALLDANIYRIEIPTGVEVGEGGVWDPLPECTYVAPTPTGEDRRVGMEIFGTAPVTTTLEIGGHVAWEETITQTGAITVLIPTPSKHWSELRTKTEGKQGGSWQNHGWFWEADPAKWYLLLPLILKQ